MKEKRTMPIGASKNGNNHALHGLGSTPANFIHSLKAKESGFEELTPSVLCNGTTLDKGTLRSCGELKSATLCGGEEIEEGTLHNRLQSSKEACELQGATLCGGEEIDAGTLHYTYNVGLQSSKEACELQGATLCAGEEIKNGTLHQISYSPATYKTKDGSGIFKFRFVNINGRFDIDIISQPSYAGRSESATVIHRISSARGGKKICINTGKEARTIEKAKKFCMEWAELTNTYIKTGKTIDQQIKENAKPKNNFLGRLAS